MEQSSPIHQAIRKHRTERGLAEVIGVSQVAVHRAKHRVENGHPLSPRMAVLVAAVLGISAHELRPDLRPPVTSEAAE